MEEIKECLHCGKNSSNYCEECYQELIGENAKLQETISKLEKENKELIEIKNSKLDEYLHKNLWICKDLAEHYIHHSKIRELLQVLNEEYLKQEKIFNDHFKKEQRDFRDYYIQKEATTIMQEISWVEGQLESLLNESN